MIKVIPHANNNVTLEIENGDQFEILTDGDHLDIKATRGDLVVHRYDTQGMEWDTAMREPKIRITNP